MIDVQSAAFLEGQRAGVKEAKKYRASLRKLTAAVAKCVDAFDAAIKLPESNARGQRFAVIVNELEFANDYALHFGLGLGLELKAKRKSR